MPDERSKRDDDEIDPDAAPPPQEFKAPKGLLKTKVDPDEFAVQSGAGSGKKPAKPAPRPPGVPPGAEVRPAPPAPGPKPAMPAPPGEVDVRLQKPEAGPRPRLANPEETGPIDVRIHKAETGPRPPLPSEAPGEVDVRMHKAEGGPKPPLPTAADLGEVDIRLQKSSRGPRIEDVEALGDFDVQMQKGKAKLPKIEAPGEFDVVKRTAVAEPKPSTRLPQPLEGEVEVVDYRKSGPVDVTGQVPDPFTKLRRIGVVDTTFARVDMGREAEDVLARLGGEIEVLRRTVPGIKDLAVEAKILIEKQGCEIVVACGMVGGQPVDKTCAHEASLAIQWAQLATNHHILEVFVHEDEAKDEAELAWLLAQRTREHAENAWRMVFDPQWLRENAGKGLRQGFADAGPIPLPR